MRLLAWILALLAALSFAGPKKTETDEELKSKVQGHLDMIVDEGAAILDDVAESIRENENVRETEELVQDMIDIAGETAEKLDGVLDDARAQVKDRLATGETAEETEKP